MSDSKDDINKNYLVNLDGQFTIINDTFSKLYPYTYVPPIIEEVLDVGKDMRLRKMMTDFFYEKLLKWIKTDPKFANHKKDLVYLKTKAGYKYVYHLLRVYVKNSRVNWYDLKDNLNYPNVKKFLNIKVGTF